MIGNRCGPPCVRTMGLFLVLLTLAVPLSAQAPSLAPAQIARIDSIFQPLASPLGPGCALGVSHRDAVVLEAAWGSAELEHRIPITATTIFEAGSVSKQFTAAAVLLLALEGKLSLDDDIRRHVPELPAYDAPITIRHLIHHTSGLKDWGAIASIGGWPRGSRIYTHAHVLQILARQPTLNYAPGAEYLYSNSNYNLLAIIAERVSGERLPALTKRLIFDPLGMTRTSWRDDFQRLVPGRAQAYGRGPEGWRLVMPNENVYGNSSLLTTVGDLLTWSANAAHMRVGGEAFQRLQQARGVLTSGDTITYAGGIQLLSHRGQPEVSHSGATAGYRAYLARYPDSGWAVALLCNSASANPTLLARDVADVLHGLPPRRPAAPAPTTQLAGRALAPAAAQALVGTYHSDEADVTVRVELLDGRLVLRIPPAGAMTLIAHDDDDRFRAGGTEVAVTRDAGGAVDGFLVSIARARNVRFVRVR